MDEDGGSRVILMNRGQSINLQESSIDSKTFQLPQQDDYQRYSDLDEVRQPQTAEPIERARVAIDLSKRAVAPGPFEYGGGGGGHRATLTQSEF